MVVQTINYCDPNDQKICENYFMHKSRILQPDCRNLVETSPISIFILN